MLSEDAKRKRHRWQIISIHITATTWILEFFGSSMLLALKFLNHESQVGNVILLEIWLVHTTVLIPALYVCNTDNCKDYLKSIGWYNAFIDRFRSNKVKPVNNLHLKMENPIHTDSPSKGICERITNNSDVNQNVKKLSKTTSDSHIVNDRKVKRRKNSV